MARFRLHAFVCTSSSSCAVDGPAVEIRNWLKQQKVALGLKEEIRINQAGCLGQCGHGPMMVVYPEEVWYSHLSLDDAKQIWQDHIIGGTPVERLRYHAAGGTNVLPKRPGPITEANPVDTGSPYFSPCTRCLTQK